MPTPNRNNVTGEQWYPCDRCGFPYPMSGLTTQDGVRVCFEACLDPRPNAVRFREQIIGDALASINPEEGSDTRWLDDAAMEDFPT